MRRFVRVLAPAGLAAAAALLVLSCATVNRLGEFDLQGRSLAAEMRVPPPPEMDVHYHLTLDFQKPVDTIISFGTTVVKAANAERVDALMREALLAVDLPGVVRDEAFASCLTVLGAAQADDPAEAEYLLDLQIHKYGVHAGSWAAAVTLRVSMTARLYATRSGEVVWRRDIWVDRHATPVMFGMDSDVGNVVTAGMLASLSEDDLEYGFSELAHDAALSVARTLQDDLYSARFIE